MGKKSERKQKKDIFESPIFVLGLPRSGTSLVAGCLNACGAWTGTTVPGGDPNPKGFYEHILIREKVIKTILSKIGCDPLGIQKLPPMNMDIEIQGLKETIKNIIKKDGYKFDRPWLYKDAKLTLLWKAFKDAFPKAKWVIVRRDKEQFIDSCLRTHFMSQHSMSRDFWTKIYDEYNDRLNILKVSETSVLELQTEPIVKGDFDCFQEVVNQLGLSFNEKAVEEFILPSFWNRANVTR